MSTTKHAPPHGPFTQRIWDAAGPILLKTEGHPFVEGLLDGTLPLEAFQFYIKQDGLYLKEFGRGLAMLAAKSKTDKEAEHLLESSKNTMLVESAMHGRWMEEWGENNPSKAHLHAPHNELYTAWLTKAATVGQFEVGMAAFAPCFWVYQHIGKFLLEKRNARGTPCDNPCYEEWIQEYAGEGFQKSVDAMLELVEHVGSSAPPCVQQQMEDAFVKGCRMEWMFWDMGYNQTYWPV